MEGVFEEARKEMFTRYGDIAEVAQETYQVLETHGFSEEKLMSECVPTTALCQRDSRRSTSTNCMDCFLMYVTRFDNK